MLKKERTHKGTPSRLKFLNVSIPLFKNKIAVHARVKGRIFANLDAFTVRRGI
jgi:hypothetical protein